MDKKLVDGIKNRMPKFSATIPVIMMDQEGNPVTHEEYMAGATDPYPYDPPFGFLAQVRANAEQVTHIRKVILFKGDGFRIPPYDPFHDRITNLVVNDPRVKARLYNARVKANPELLEIKEGVFVKVMDNIKSDIVVIDSPAFKRHIPGVTKYW